MEGVVAFLLHVSSCLHGEAPPVALEDASADDGATQRWSSKDASIRDGERRFNELALFSGLT